MTHPPETASTVTLIGIPGFWPSGASGKYRMSFGKIEAEKLQTSWYNLLKISCGLNQKSCPAKSAQHFEHWRQKLQRRPIERLASNSALLFYLKWDNCQNQGPTFLWVFYYNRRTLKSFKIPRISFWIL